MKSSTAAALATLFFTPTSFASPFLYNYTELSLYSGEQGNFAAANAGDQYAVSGLQTSHVQKYKKWIAELGGNYGRNSLEVDSGEEQSFTELGIEAAVGRYLSISDSIEFAGFVGGNYVSLETLEFTSSETYFFVRARASYAMGSSLGLDLDYETQNGTNTSQSLATITATWDNHKNLSAAIQHEINLDSDNAASENRLRLAYQTAPDLKFYVQHRSASHDSGDTAVIEVGARILLGRGELKDAAPSDTASTPQGRAEQRRKSADEALRRDLPSSIR
jgi:hypothetical protein